MALRAYVAAATALEAATPDEFNEVYLAAENARLDFERVRDTLRENLEESSGEAVDPGVNGHEPLPEPAT